MQCPQCGSTHIRKNGIKQGKQNHMRVSIAVVNSFTLSMSEYSQNIITLASN